jgi:hypothetical protein
MKWPLRQAAALLSMMLLLSQQVDAEVQRSAQAAPEAARQEQLCLEKALRERARVTELPREPQQTDPNRN